MGEFEVELAFRSEVLFRRSFEGFSLLWLLERDDDFCIFANVNAGDGNVKSEGDDEVIAFCCLFNGGFKGFLRFLFSFCSLALLLLLFVWVLFSNVRLSKLAIVYGRLLTVPVNELGESQSYIEDFKRLFSTFSMFC